MGARSLIRRPFLWLTVAALGAATGITLQLLVGTTSQQSPVILVATDPAPARSASVPADVITPRAAPPASVASVPSDQTEQASAPSPVQPAASNAQPAPAPVAPAVDTGLRLQIPALSIDARIVTLGFTGDGQLDVPRDGSSVGWYDISPRPGQPGNALLGAHFDWDGSLAVFAGLSRLSSGDLVILGDGATETTYQVNTISSVGWDHPVSDVLTSNANGSSLTLFTCGGTFDTERSEYDQRLIVRADQIGPSSPLAARRP